MRLHGTLAFLCSCVPGLVWSCSGARPSDLNSGIAVTSVTAEGGSFDAAPPDAVGIDVGTVDAGTEGATADGPGAEDAAPYSGPLSCGNQNTCNTPSQICCVTFAGFAQNYRNMEACLASGTDCANEGGTPVYCTSSSQCPGGQVCCGKNANMSVSYTEVSCQPSCNAHNDRVFCDPTLPNECPGSTHCGMSTLLTAFYACLN